MSFWLFFVLLTILLDGRLNNEAVLISHKPCDVSVDDGYTIPACPNHICVCFFSVFFLSQKCVFNVCVCMYQFVFVYRLILYNYLREGLDMRTVLKCTFFLQQGFLYNPQVSQCG